MGWGKHPKHGQTLKGWSKVGDGTEEGQEGSSFGVPSPKALGTEAHLGDGWSLVARREAGEEGRECEGDEEPGDLGNWMGLGQSQEAEELHREGFLGFDDP